MTPMQCLKHSKGYKFNYTFNPILSNEDPRKQEHYKLITNLTAPYRKAITHSWINYAGPWLEEAWISHFCCSRPLSDFGDFVPLFINWIDMFKSSNDTLRYQEILKEIFSLLEKDFLYVTVSQSGFGIEGRPGPWYEMPPNLFILSSSEHGHVPIPHFIRELRWRPSTNKTITSLYLGNLWTHFTRQQVLDVMKFFPGEFVNSDKIPNFPSAYRSSKFVFSPRGYSRGCFRTAELIQLGSVMIFVHDGFPWLPYKTEEFHWEKLAFIVSPKELMDQFPEIKDTPLKKVMEMEEEVKKRREYFTLKGVMKQIEYYFQNDPRCLLRCERFEFYN